MELKGRPAYIQCNGPRLGITTGILSRDYDDRRNELLLDLNLAGKLLASSAVSKGRRGTRCRRILGQRKDKGGEGQAHRTRFIRAIGVNQ